MLRRIMAFGWLAVAAGSWAAKGEGPALRWQFAGENQGIRFYLKIENECRDADARVDVKLENTLDHAVTVSFRIVDPDWKQSFERELEPKAKDTAVRFSPEEGTACHPYVDEVYVASRGTQVTHSSEKEEAAEP